jgi:hypothetical protein
VQIPPRARKVLTMKLQLGDKIYCIETFSVSPYKEKFLWKTAKTFSIGDTVKYLSSFVSNNEAIVLFDVDGVQYSVSESNFVTKDCWNNLRNYFKKFG